jgi:hypothetical protein
VRVGAGVRLDEQPDPDGTPLRVARVDKVEERPGRGVARGSAEPTYAGLTAATASVAALPSIPSATGPAGGAGGGIRRGSANAATTSSTW